MDEDGGVAGPWTTWRLVMLGLAVAAWLTGFAVLQRVGTWSPLALLGPALAALAFWSDAPTRALLRSSAREAAVGFAAGLAMVLTTHAAFALVVSWLPGAGAATERLFQLLNVSGFSPDVRAALIVLVASSEEVIFRGAWMDPGPRGAATSPDRAARRVLLSSAVYALAMSTLGSALLVLCAFCGGIVWGTLRVATRSLTAPIVAHVVWDLGVLVVWPLIRVRAS